MAEERWRPIDDFPAYEVSDQGRVRRVTPSMGATVGKVLRPEKFRGEYQQVLLRRGGKGYSRRVHTLVAVAFLGPRPAGHEVNHKDFDPSNNAWTNLEYCTHADNNRYSAAAGRIKPPTRRGEHSLTAKLTEISVREIRRRYAAGERPGVIGKDFRIRPNHVWNIATRRAWKHVA